MSSLRFVVMTFVAASALGASLADAEQTTLERDLDLGGGLLLPEGSVLTLKAQKSSKTTWDVERVTLPPNTTLFRVLTGEVTLASAECVRLAEPDAEPVACTVPRAHPAAVLIQGHAVRNPDFYPNGMLRKADLVADTKQRGLTCRGGAPMFTLFDDGMIQECHLAKRATIAGYPVAAAYIGMESHDHARPAYFELSKAYTLGRLKLPAGTIVWLDSSDGSAQLTVKAPSFRVGRVVCDARRPIVVRRDGSLEKCEPLAKK